MIIFLWCLWFLDAFLGGYMIGGSFVDKNIKRLIVGFILFLESLIIVKLII